MWTKRPYLVDLDFGRAASHIVVVVVVVLVMDLIY